MIRNYTRDDYKKMRDEMDPWKRPENSEMFIAKNYLSYVPDFLIYTVDKIAVEINGCGADDAWRKLWIGKHIGKIRNDIASLYKYFIHHEDWRSDKTIIELLDKHRQMENSITQHQQLITIYRHDKRYTMNDIKAVQEWLEESAFVLDKIKTELNKIRASHFGDSIPYNYFGVTK